LKAQREVKYSTKLQQLPPWLEYPHVPRYDICWRMGGSQSYWESFWDEFMKLTPKEQRWYQQDFPEPNDWTGVYMDMIKFSQTDEVALDEPTDKSPNDVSQSEDSQ